MKVGKLKNREAAGKNKLKREMIKGGGLDLEAYEIWPLRVVLCLKIVKCGW